MTANFTYFSEFIQKLMNEGFDESYLSGDSVEVLKLYNQLRIKNLTIDEIGIGCSSSDEAIYAIVQFEGVTKGVYLAESKLAPYTSERLGVKGKYFAYIDDLKDDGMLNGLASTEKVSSFETFEGAVHFLGVTLISLDICF